jgi:anti-sigma B factor antagonist
MKLRTRREGDAAVLILEGELDLSGEAAFASELQRLEDGASPRIVVDLERLTFIDSTGVRLLLEATMRSRMDSDRLRLRSPSPQVARTLQLMHVADRVDFIESRG